MELKTLKTLNIRVGAVKTLMMMEVGVEMNRIEGRGKSLHRKVQWVKIREQILM